MRAVVVLALLLSVSTPPGLWHANAEAASKGASTAAMGSPANALCQLVRDCAKAEKTFSSGWFAAVDRTSGIQLGDSVDLPLWFAPPLHAIAIDCPPLAPRPPPVVSAR